MVDGDVGTAPGREPNGVSTRGAVPLAIRRPLPGNPAGGKCNAMEARMIEISWVLSLSCNGGRFYVQDGTPASEIALKVDYQVQRSIDYHWSPAPAPPKDGT